MTNDGFQVLNKSLLISHCNIKIQTTHIVFAVFNKNRLSSRHLSLYHIHSHILRKSVCWENNILISQSNILLCNWHWNLQKNSAFKNIVFDERLTSFCLICQILLSCFPTTGILPRIRFRRSVFDYLYLLLHISSCGCIVFPHPIDFHDSPDRILKVKL